MNVLYIIAVLFLLSKAVHYYVEYRESKEVKREPAVTVVGDGEHVRRLMSKYNLNREDAVRLYKNRCKIQDDMKSGTVFKR